MTRFSAAGTFTAEYSQGAPGKCGGAKSVVQEEKITITYLEEMCSLVQKPINNRAVRACPDIYLDSNVLISEEP
jgi:hypothetical protein